MAKVLEVLNLSYEHEPIVLHDLAPCELIQGHGRAFHKCVIAFIS